MCNCVEEKWNMLDKVCFELVKCIDILSDIDGKLAYSEDYTDGYKDACIAIKNSAKTIIMKAKEEVSR